MLVCFQGDGNAVGVILTQRCRPEHVDYEGMDAGKVKSSASGGGRVVGLHIPNVGADPRDYAAKSRHGRRRYSSTPV
jgi:hypothetical protein